MKTYFYAFLLLVGLGLLWQGPHFRTEHVIGSFLLAIPLAFLWNKYRKQQK